MEIIFSPEALEDLQFVEHRLIYKWENEKVVIAQLRNHY